MGILHNLQKHCTVHTNVYAAYQLSKSSRNETLLVSFTLEVEKLR